jgi:uncharacterized protein YndB with AHSA1/START domain
MSQTETASQSAVIVERVLPHPPEKVWRVLTTSEFLAEWLMPNDFQPVLGSDFTFRTKAWGKWDGIVAGKVLECDPPRRLRYSWISGSSSGQGAPLDTVVTWTLTPVEAGTRLRMEHEGFGPTHQFEHTGATAGWAHNIGKLAELADGLDARR